jgi:hypothetical protein
MSLDYVDPSTPPPVEWTGAIFPEPMLYRLAPLWLFLLVIAVLGLLFYRHRLFDARSDGRRAPSIIYAEIRKAINQALYATGPATIPAGQKVIETLKLYLGPILAFSGEFRGPFSRLENAVSGKAEAAAHKPAHKPEPKPATVVVKSTSAGEGTVTTDKVIQVVGPAQVITIGDSAQHDGHGGHETHHHDEAMSTNDQTAAVRYALERLHEFWTQNTVEPKLKAIHDALSIREPKGARSSRDLPRPREGVRRIPADTRPATGSAAVKPKV